MDKIKRKMEIIAEDKGKERRLSYSLAIKAVKDANPFTQLQRPWTVH